MQAYQMEPLRQGATREGPRRKRRSPALSFIDLWEPLLLLAVGALVLAPEQTPPQTILIGLAALLTPYLLRWIFYGAPSRSTLADLPLALLFLVLTPLSLWVSPYFWEATWPEFVRMAWGGAVFMGVVNWALPLWQRVEPTPAARYRLPVRLWLLTFVYLALGVALALVVLVNMNTVTKIPVVDQVAAQLKTQDVAQLELTDQFNPNRVAALLVLYAPLPLAFLLTSGSRRAPAKPGEQAPASRSQGKLGRRLLQSGLRGLGRLGSKALWLLLWLFFAGGLLLTQSRAGLLAAAVATVVVLILTWRQPEGGLRLTGGLFLVLFLAGMGYFTLAIQYTDFFNGAATTLDSGSVKMVNTASLQGRVIIWQRALNGLADQPLTGLGLGAFDQIAHDPYPLPGYIPGDIHHAHNLFLQTALDFGAPGLIVFLALVALAATSLIRLYRNAPLGSQLSVWATGLIGCFVAFVIYNLLDALTLGARPAVAMWFLLALAISAGHYAETERGKTSA